MNAPRASGVPSPQAAAALVPSPSPEISEIAEPSVSIEPSSARADRVVQESARSSALAAAPSDCGDPRLLTLLPSQADFLASLDSFDKEDEPWPPSFNCTPLELYRGPGEDGDGSKWLCGLRQLQAPCTVYSLGSRLDFSFETAVSKHTPCDIVTVDCTVDASQTVLPERTRYFPLCLGAENVEKFNPDAGPTGAMTQFVTLPRLMEIAGHTSIDLLKVCVYVCVCLGGGGG
jgi:hypothetical protein